MSRSETTEASFDVAVIGAGVVGAAVAQALSKFAVRVVVLEGRSDVGAGTSKANTAILHTGFDAVPGSDESRLVRRGYGMLGAYAADVGIAVERTGALLVAWDEEQLAALEGLQHKAEANGYLDCQRLSASEVTAAEPHLGPGALGALSVPGEALIDPWSVPIALVTEAVVNGVELRRSTRVHGISVGAELTVLDTSGGPVSCRWLVNSAGLGADVLEADVGHHAFTVTPRRGQLLVFDKLSRSLVNHIVLPVPSKMGKGVLVSPTVFGNVMVGPTAEDLDDRDDTGTTADGIGSLLAKAGRIVPALLDEELTATYAGLRAATEHSDYCIALDPSQRILTLGGIRSTGLTASMAIAEEAVEHLASAGLVLARRAQHVAITMPNLGEASDRPWMTGGRIVCHCEKVTEDEIVGACVSTVPPVDLDGLRRRTRVLMGRCQGFFCGAEVRSMLERETA